MYNLALVTSITSAIPHFLLKWQKIEISRFLWYGDQHKCMSYCNFCIYTHPLNQLTTWHVVVVDTWRHLFPRQLLPWTLTFFVFVCLGFFCFCFFFFYKNKHKSLSHCDVMHFTKRKLKCGVLILRSCFWGIEC